MRSNETREIVFKMSDYILHAIVDSENLPTKGESIYQEALEEAKENLPSFTVIDFENAIKDIWRCLV